MLAAAVAGRGLVASAWRGAAAAGQARLMAAAAGGNYTTPEGVDVVVQNPGGKHRVIVTKELPGTTWRETLAKSDCRVEVAQGEHILSRAELKGLCSGQVDGVIGQLTEPWDADMFKHLKGVGCKVYSNYAVGFNNVEVPGASAVGIPVGNTPGVLTETTAELAAALTLAAARRVVEADRFMRDGKFHGWLPNMFVGSLLQNKTVGIVGAGRIGAAYARMMIEGHKMNCVYYDMVQNTKLEGYVKAYSAFLESQGEKGVTIQRAEAPEGVFAQADVVSMHCALDNKSKNLVNAALLSKMKKDAVFVNTARGPVHNEKDLVAHLRANPDFRVGLDVFEHEPDMEPGLAECENAVIVPHIASASMWTRGGMASLAAANIRGVLEGFPIWNDPHIEPFLESSTLPDACPSIVNGRELKMKHMGA